MALVFSAPLHVASTGSTSWSTWDSRVAVLFGPAKDFFRVVHLPHDHKVMRIEEIETVKHELGAPPNIGNGQLFHELKNDFQVSRRALLAELEDVQHRIYLSVFFQLHAGLCHSLHPGASARTASEITRLR
ncbi:MAG: hypothetical protein JO273_17800 [Methylobacteriaceae bacterium]|nr:hypothetical protein [Methylobacteriaceae bacterium]